MSIPGFCKNPSELIAILEGNNASCSFGLLPGEFELLYAAHGIILETAKKHCDLLIVALFPDQYFQTKYGNFRPFCSLAERAEMLLSTKYADYIIEFSWDLLALIQQIKTRPTLKIIAEQSSQAELLFENMDIFFKHSLEFSFDESAATQYAILKILEKSQLKMMPVSASDVYAGYSPYLTKKQLPSIIADHQLPSCIDQWHAQKEFLITTNGSFDLLHLGHIRYLKEAKKMGGKFLVLVNDDQSIQNSKGRLRPIFDQQERMHALSTLACVDHVIPFSGDNPLYLLEQIKPDVHVKGGSFEASRIAQEKHLVESHGGTFHCFELTAGFSSTNLLEKIVASYQK